MRQLSYALCLLFLVLPAAGFASTMPEEPSPNLGPVFDPWGQKLDPVADPWGQKLGPVADPWGQ